MKRFQYLLLVGCVVLDQVTKHWALVSLSRFKPLDVIPPILSFQLVFNHGAAYGILQNQRLFLIAVSISVVIGGIVFSKHIIQSKWSLYGLTFLLSGAVGNLIDRVRWGYVVDFVNIRIFPLFNVADMLIDLGIVLFLIEIFFYGKTANRHAK